MCAQGATNRLFCSSGEKHLIYLYDLFFHFVGYCRRCLFQCSCYIFNATLFFYCLIYVDRQCKTPASILTSSFIFTVFRSNKVVRCTSFCHFIRNVVRPAKLFRENMVEVFNGAKEMLTPKIRFIFAEEIRIKLNEVFQRIFAVQKIV